MATPHRFQHFEVLKKPDGSPHLLGKGAMGFTYKAFDRNLLSLVVVKVIVPEQMDRPEARQRFLLEAQSMAKIRHPHVADVFFFGDSPQGVFYAMEFCDGPTVQEYVEERGAMDAGDVFILGLQAAQALQAVEQHNLIHRDIKPSNIILINDSQGRSQIKLIDFGLAREVLNNPAVSQHGFVGTPTFASPEQLLEQEHLDIRSDIYSLGVTLWFMLTGRPPFSGSQFEVMFHHVNTPPPVERLPAMPEPALKLLERMLGKSPDDRFPNAAALVDAFREVIAVCGFALSTGAHLTLMHREEQGSALGMSSYQILSQALESDAAGKVFRARDAHDGRIVALKYLHSSLTDQPEVLGRIQRLALSLRELEHPNLTQVLGFEKSGDGIKIIFEWVAGPSLLAVLKARGQLTLREAAPLLGQVAGALDFAGGKGVSSVETDPHQIILTSPVFGEEAAEWPRQLREPVAAWGEVQVKINPLRLSPAAQDYPSLPGAPVADAAKRGPLIGVFQQLSYRLLGGAGGSSQTQLGSGYVPIPALGAEANDLLEGAFDPVGAGVAGPASCVDLVRKLCQAEGLPAPVFYEPPPEPEEDLNLTRDGTVTTPVTSAPGTSGPGFATKGRVAPGTLHPGSSSSQAGTRWGSTAGRSASGSQFGTRGRHATRFGSVGPGGISTGYETRMRGIEAQRRQLEAEGGDRLKKADYLEATRAMLDDERMALAEAREAFIRQERERAQRAEEERKKLEEERIRLEEKTGEIEERRREQERLEQEIRLRAQLEFQKFQEERRQRDTEAGRQREEMEASLREREEKALLREQSVFKKLREERERLQKLQQELDQGKSPSQQQAEEALRNQVAALEAERQALAGQQVELDRRLQEQNAEIERLREQFAGAEQELENRYRKLAEQEAAAEQERQEKLETERQRLAAERLQLERDHAALAAEQKAGTEATQSLLLQQQQENGLALARLAEQEARFVRERGEQETQRRQREAALAEELAQARQELEAERAALAQEAGNARQAGLAELEREREAVASHRAQLAAQEAALAAEVAAKNQEIENRLARHQQELEEERAAVAVERERLDAEHQRLSGEFAAEKEAFLREIETRRELADREHRRQMQERAAELALLEHGKQERLEALRKEIEAEESRLQEQRQEVFTQERLIARMDQEAGYQDQETKEQLDAEQKRLEEQRSEIEVKLLELQKAQKKRLVTLVVGTIIGVTAASGAGWYIKGRLIDPARLKGQEAWVQYDKERQITSGSGDWPAVLNWCVQTDERFRNEPDPVIRKFYEEKRGAVLADAQQAVQGILENLEKGWKPPAGGTPEFDKLRQNLGIVSTWDGISSDRLLVLARLDMPWLTAQQNPGAALEVYAGAVAKNPEFAARLQPELSVTVQGLLDDFLPDHSLENRDQLFEQMGKLPVEARNSVPRLWLLLYLMKAEEARAARPQAGNFTIALNAINAPGSSPETRDFYARDPEWERILRPEVHRILETLKPHPDIIPRLEEVLRTTAEQWRIDEPYLMLAASETVTQKKLDFYLAAEKLSGNPLAKAKIAGFYLRQAAAQEASGNTAAARQRIQEAMPRLDQAAAEGEAEAMFLLSDVLRQGQAGEPDLDAAIGWAIKAKELGHPEAAFSLGMCYLEKGESPPDRAVLKLAEAALREAATRGDSLTAGEAWFRLAYTYSLLKDEPNVVKALEEGAKLENVDSLFMLGKTHMAGPPFFAASNLTLGRDLITRAARAGNAEAREFLRSRVREWKQSGLPADREWLLKNTDLTGG